MSYTSATEATAPAPGSHIADPGPLGLAGFALTTFVLSMVNTDIIPQALVGGALGLALAYGGIAQFAAGIWEFAKGNTFGATAFCSYGAVLDLLLVAGREGPGQPRAATATRWSASIWSPGRSSPRT